MTRSNLKRKEDGTVTSSRANENGLELLNKISWKTALQKYFDETMPKPSSLMAYITKPCVSTDLQVRFVWCLIGMRKWEYEATIETKASSRREQQVELMGALKVLIARDASSMERKRRDALCLVKIVVDHIPTPVLEEGE